MIGIVASRLVERFGRPVVLIAGEGRPLEGLRAARCRASTSTPASPPAPTHLERFGGHRAAAGLTIRPDQLEPFAAAFAAHADGVLADEDLAASTRIDAIVPAAALTLDLARELEQLAPVRAREPRRDAARRRLRGRRRRPRSARASTCASASASTGATPAARSRSASAASSTACRPGRTSTSPSGSSRTAGTAPSRRSSSSAASSTPPTPTRSSATWLAGLWRAGEAAWTPEARRIFARARDRRRRRQAAAARVAHVPGAARARRPAQPAAGRLGSSNGRGDSRLAAAGASRRAGVPASTRQRRARARASEPRARAAAR